MNQDALSLITRLTLKNSLFAVTRLTHQNCPYPKHFIDIYDKEFFLFECLNVSVSELLIFFSIYLSECNIVQSYSSREATYMILNSNLNLSCVKVIQKILSFSSVKKKKKKKKKKMPTDGPYLKTMGRVTANKIFIKDGPIKLWS